MDQYIKFYNTMRPHQEANVNRTLPEAELRDKAGHETLDRSDQNDAGVLKPLPVGEIVRHKFMSGLLSHYERVAA